MKRLRKSASRRQVRFRRSSLESLESRRVLAASIAGGTEVLDFETDPRIIKMFYGPLEPGRPVPPIQAIAVLTDADDDHGDGRPDGLPADTGADSPAVGAAPFALDQTFKLHSRPDSNFTIYLDFDGHVTVGTTWNSAYGIGEIVHPDYWGGDGSSFSDDRLQLIQEIWQVVTEDFAPFDVDVTTEEPSDLDDLRYNGTSDTRWGTRVVMTKQSFTDCGCGGHAYIGAFDDSQDEPAIVYNSGLKAGSETVSHEVGHQLGLHHDGNGSNTYYSGHGSGDTSWGPIMGAPFSKLTTQWSDGNYFDATLANEDDLAIITGNANFPFVNDDYADVRTDATAMLVRQTSIEAFGIIETNDDVDWLRFTTEGGDVTLDVDVTGYKPNLDVWAGLFDSNGEFITDANPSSTLSASFGTLSLDAGEYFLKLDGAPRDSTYDPITDQLIEPTIRPYNVSPPSGYSDYGSLGQYRVHGTIVDATAPTVRISAATSSVVEGQSLDIELATSDQSSGTFEIQILPRRQSRPSSPAPNGTESIDFGITATQTISVVGGMGTLSIPIVDDAEIEGTESFRVVISDPSGYAIDNGYVDIDVLESQSLFSITAIDASTREGDLGSGQTQQFLVRREGRADNQQSIGWKRTATGVHPADSSDFVSIATGIVSFAPGQTTANLDMLIAGDNVVEPDETYQLELLPVAGETALISPEQSSANGTILDDESVVSFISNAQFRIRQVAFNDSNGDNFAIDNFAITGTSLQDDFDPSIDATNWDSILSAIAADNFPNSDGNALFFNGPSQRQATTIPISPALGAKAEFDIIFAGSNGPGLNATEQGEDAVFEYLVDGSDWVTLQRFDEQEFTSWTPVSISLPTDATFTPRMFDEGNVGNTTATLSIPRTGFIDKAISVDWTVIPSGASPVNAEDFGGTFPSGTVNFAAGERTATVQFDIAGDFQIESDETFSLVVSNNTGGPIVNSMLSGVITNDDVAGPEINVVGSSDQTIANGDSSPSTDDGTNFGVTSIGAPAISKTFRIENLGLTTLNLNSIAIEGPDAAAFSISDAGTNAIDPGESTTFSIDFNPIGQGDYDATVVINNDDPSESNYSFAITGSANDVLVDEIVLNDGSSARSQIESITVRFNQRITHEPLARAFQIRLVSDRSQFFPYPTVLATDIDDKTEVRLTFPASNPSTGETGTWFDGFYELRIDANQIQSASDPSFTMLSDVYFGTLEGQQVNLNDQFFRLFGDIDGNQTLNAIDLAAFQSAMLPAPAGSGYTVQFDYDSDGDIDQTDLAQFRRRLRR
ncbi:choice-of-anchor D domain-containing protein [Rhodopirellula sp. MGV]|uniref:choice-of-anchor D domain-containing protein n=1 Tax=Rhodopirellula sp. MGV TaxID=2023130 RepID=UPI0013046ED6|nr:choice-of-anchor D domain-containing protein [Rhodopirellula sp. MGV]